MSDYRQENHHSFLRLFFSKGVVRSYESKPHYSVALNQPFKSYDSNALSKQHGCPLLQDELCVQITMQLFLGSSLQVLVLYYATTPTDILLSSTVSKHVYLRHNSQQRINSSIQCWSVPLSKDHSSSIGPLARSGVTPTRVFRK